MTTLTAGAQPPAARPQPVADLAVPVHQSPARGASTGASDIPAFTLTTETWQVTAAPPDDDGDVAFEARAVVAYTGQMTSYLARLRCIAYDRAGQVPVDFVNVEVMRDIDDGDAVEFEASWITRLGESGADGCRVDGQVMVYPGHQVGMFSALLPEDGAVGGRADGGPAGAVTLVAWVIRCVDVSEDSSSYTLDVAVRNDRAMTMATVTARVRVQSRKGELWTKEYVTVEGLLPGERRALSMLISVSERARARKGATVEVSVVACEAAAVTTLAPLSPVLRAPDLGTLEDTDAEENEGDQASVGERRLRGRSLLVRAGSLLQGSRDEIVSACGYRGSSRLVDFYRALVLALGLSQIGPDSEELRACLQEDWGASPILDGAVIRGRRTFRVCRGALKRRWTKKTWNPNDWEGSPEGPYELGISDAYGGKWAGYFDYESALAAVDVLESPLVDFIRPAYRSLGDDVDGMELEEFLSEFGEQPRDLFELRRRFDAELGELA